jgi:hypothetical protein
MEMYLMLLGWEIYVFPKTNKTAYFSPNTLIGYYDIKEAYEIERHRNG